MIDCASTDSSLKKLGFWFCALGILLGVVVATHSHNPQSLQDARETHRISISHSPATVTAPAPVATPAAGEPGHNMPALQNVIIAQIETVPRLPVPPVDRKISADDIARPKSVSVRGKRAERLYRAIILRVARRHKVDPTMVKAIIMAESSFNPRAISKSGALGLMQLMPKTAKSLGVNDAFDPENNINAGVLYFKTLLNEFRGDVELALAAYNAGSRKVKEYQGVPPFKATQAYIKKVFEYYRHYQNESLHPADRA